MCWRRFFVTLAVVAVVLPICEDRIGVPEACFFFFTLAVWLL